MKLIKAMLVACAAFVGCAQATTLGVLSYSIDGQSLIVNTNAEDVHHHACKPYAQDGRVFIDLSEEGTRSATWATAVFESMSAYKPLTVTLSEHCDPVKGLKVTNVKFNELNDSNGGSGVKMVYRNQVISKFIRDEVRANVYGYPIEIQIAADDPNFGIQISKTADFAKVAASSTVSNHGGGTRRSTVTMIVPAGHYYKVINSNAATVFGMIYK